MTNRVPAWVTVLECARAWGVPPWEIAELRGPRKKWYWRQRAWDSAMRKREQMEAEKWEKR